MIELICFAVLLAVCAIFMCRNTVVYLIRVHFIFHEPDGFYEALPSYERMLYSHWDKWSKSQWRRHVESKGAT